MLGKKLTRKDGYRIEDGKTCVDLVVEDINQLFDERDPAPFLQRDLDEDAVDFIVSSIQEFPLKHPTKLQIYFSNRKVGRTKKKEITNEEITTAIRNYFKHYAEITSKKLTKLLKDGRTSLFMGAIVVTGCLLLGENLARFDGVTPVRLFRAGIEIAGWVALWRPIEVLLYDWWSLYEKRKMLEKIASIEISLTDQKVNVTTTDQV